MDYNEYLLGERKTKIAWAFIPFITWLAFDFFILLININNFSILGIPYTLLVFPTFVLMVVLLFKRQRTKLLVIPFVAVMFNGLFNMVVQVNNTYNSLMLIAPEDSFGNIAVVLMLCGRMIIEIVTYTFLALSIYSYCDERWAGKRKLFNVFFYILFGVNTFITFGSFALNFVTFKITGITLYEGLQEVIYYYGNIFDPILWWTSIFMIKKWVENPFVDEGPNPEQISYQEELSYEWYE